MTSPDLVVRLADVGLQDVPTVGGKGASLGELTRAGIRVPGGFAVTTRAFEEAIASLDPAGQIRTDIESLAPDDADALAATSERIRQMVEGVVLPAELTERICALYRELCAAEGGSDVPVAVRSSATSEDSADASFAGLQDTYLWVRGQQEVLEHVRRCWASLYSVESLTYRRRRQVSEQGLAMAVVVQRMVDARSSGVMFTRSPVNGDRSVVAIDASWGLGSAVVSGEVTPDAFVVSKVTGDVTRRTIATKAAQDRPDPLGKGVRTDPVPEELQNAPSVSDDEIRTLVEIARRVERHYGCPQDIEWAISAGPSDAGSVLLLQSRPETVWAGREKPPAAAPKEKAFQHVLGLFGGATTGGPGRETP